MPYNGPADDKLPPAVQKLPRSLRQRWVEVFNDNYDPEDEGKAFRAAWSAVRTADKEKKMSKLTAWLKPALAPAEKLVNLGQWRDAVLQAFVQQFGEEPSNREIEDDWNPLKLLVYEVLDDHCIVNTAVDGWFKVPYTKTMAQVDGSDQEVVASVVFADRAEWVPVVPVFSEFKAFTQADGRVRWTLVSSGGFEDRDGEIVSTAFLESAVKEADRTGERGPLLIFHVPGSNIGTVDFQAVVGEPGFLLESGLFSDSDAGRRAAAYYQAHAKETGASIKFLFANQTPDGVFLPPGKIIERSLLPRGRAAFPWSALDIAEVEKMAQLSQEKRDALEAVLGKDLAVEIIDQLSNNAEALKEAGVRFKELGNAEQPVEAATPEPEPDDDEDGEPLIPVPSGEAAIKQTNAELKAQTGEFEVLLTPETLETVAEKAAGVLAGQIASIQTQLQSALDGQMTSLQAVVEKLKQDIAALQRTDEIKIAEKVANLPRATVRAAQAPQLYRPTVDKAAQTGEQAADSTMLDRLLQTVHGS